MSYFTWKPEFEIGHPLIDEQHKQMLLLGEAMVDPLLNSAEHRPAAAQLQALIDFTVEHFAFEEDLMLSAGYPEAEEHAKFHASLLAELETYCSRLQRGQHKNAPGLISFIWDWLSLHVDGQDRKLVNWLRTRESEGRAG